KFENFPAEILVESFAGESPGHGIWTDRLSIVEVKLHRRMVLDRVQHVGEFTRDMRANGFALEGTDELTRLRFHDRDREMVRPEPHESLPEGLRRLEALEEARGHLLQEDPARFHGEGFERLGVLGASRLLTLHEIGNKRCGAFEG